MTVQVQQAADFSSALLAEEHQKPSAESIGNTEVMHHSRIPSSTPVSERNVAKS